jgi:hypothetical protein
MNRIEDRLAAAADELRHEVADASDVDAAFDAVTAAPRRHRSYLLGAAAIVVALVAGAALVATGRGGREVIADGGPSIPPVTTTAIDEMAEGDVAFEILLDEATAVPVGTMSYAGVEPAFRDQWQLAALDGDPPEVDFERRIVLSLTRVGCGEPLVAVELERDRLVPRFEEEECDAARAAPRTVAFALDRAGLPQAFHLVLATAVDGSYPNREVRVDLSSQSLVAQAMGDGRLPVPEGPDLAPADPGREITFAGVAEVRLGEQLDPSEVAPHGDSGCGYWGPSEPTHDGDEPLGGLVDGATGPSPRVTSIMVRNPTYRTASGVGVGTTLATLQRIYGDDLVVDRSDGWEHPTDGLLGYYQDVAAIRDGGHALTFSLRSDVVEVVKVSAAEFWGDDEGCA